MRAIYTAQATATGAGRDGHVRSSDQALDMQLSVPSALGGAGGTGANPEQLFAAGYAACFHSSLQLAARREGVALSESSVTATVGIGPDGRGLGLTAELLVGLPGVDGEKARALMEAAHQLCPYSRAVQDNIEVGLRLAGPDE